MKKFFFALLALVALPMTMKADALHDSIPSNYGGWLNLTDGYVHEKNYNNPKMTVEIDGNTIHMCWVEQEKVDMMRNIWYRRSTDLGKTWEEARVVLSVYESYSSTQYGLTKLMTVSNGMVHIAAIHDTPSFWGYKEGTSSVLYIRSEDGGQTFSEVRSIGGIVSDYYRFDNVMVQSDANTVVVAAQRGADEGKHIQDYFYSVDGGKSFTILKETISSGSHKYRNLLDLQVSGERFASLFSTNDWYSGLIYGNMYVLCSDGNNTNVTNIAPICTKQNGEEVPYSYPIVMTGGNGESFNYHPQMVLDGQTVQVRYAGNPGYETIKSGGLDYGYTLYQRSEDFGKTWGKAVLLPESNGGAGTIAAKGDNVYVTTNRNGLNTVYYSHDKGANWESVTQTVFSNNVHNPARDYSLAIDPTDPTGKHVVFTGPRMFYVESNDGFSTISRNFCLGAEAWMGTYYCNNHALNTYFDNYGQQHWFMQTSVPSFGIDIDGYQARFEGSRDIVYCRPEAEPDFSNEDMALNLHDYITPHHRAVIPMSPSLQQKQAITVECWVRPDNLQGTMIAACTDNSSHEGSVFTGGWYINQVITYGGEVYYEGGICIDTDEFCKGVRVHFDRPKIVVPQGQWCHVALTYDDSVESDNVCLYMNGNLAATNTIHGNLVLGKNPICLGRASLYYEPEGLLDNFSIWSRALTADEIKAHAADANANDGTDSDCRVLLTFDGSLKDKSQYGNDGMALMDIYLTTHEVIPPAGISVPTVDAQPANQDIFTIDGRKVNSKEPLEKGIYIKKGQKFIVR